MCETNKRGLNRLIQTFHQSWTEKLPANMQLSNKDGEISIKLELQFGRPDDIKPDPVVAGHPAAALYRRWPRRQGPAAKQRSRQRAALFQASRACLVSHPSRWSFSFILGPLHWSSSWHRQPSIAGCRLFQTLLWTQLADFAQFFCKMYLLYMWPSRKTCLVWFGWVLPP